MVANIFFMVDALSYWWIEVVMLVLLSCRRLSSVLVLVSMAAAAAALWTMSMFVGVRCLQLQERAIELPLPRDADAWDRYLGWIVCFGRQLFWPAFSSLSLLFVDGR